MKLRYIIFFMSLALISCESPEIRKHTVEFHQNGKPRLEKTYQIKESDSTAIFETLYYENGTVKMEGALDQDGQRHGEWKAYFNDGSPWSIGRFEHGKRAGESIVYHPNGQKYSIGQYKDGKQTGVWKFWNKEGKALDEKNFGTE